MSSKPKSNGKRQRVAETKAPAGNTLRLTARNLPSSLEDHALSFLDMDSVCDLRFLSKDMLQLVTSFVSATKRAVFATQPFLTDADPDRQPVLRSIPFLTQHARCLREFTVEPHSHHNTWHQSLHHYSACYLPLLIQRCAPTLEIIRPGLHKSAAAADAAVQCPQLREFDSWRAPGEDMSLTEQRLLQMVASCPKLEALNLILHDHITEPRVPIPDETVHAVLSTCKLKRLTLAAPGPLSDWLPRVRWSLLESLTLHIDSTLENVAPLAEALNAARALTSLEVRGLDHNEAPTDREIAAVKALRVQLPQLRSLNVSFLADWAPPLLSFDAPAVRELEAPFPVCMQWSRGATRLESLRASFGLQWQLNLYDMLHWLPTQGVALAKFDVVFVSVEPQAVRLLIARCPLLVELSVALTGQGDDGLLGHVLRSLPRLLVLRLSQSKRSGTSESKASAKPVPLRTLTLLSVGDAAQLAGFAFPALTSLKLRGFVAADLDLRAMPALQKLTLMGKRVTEDSLQHQLAAVGSSLTKLSLKDCSHLRTLGPLLETPLPRLRCFEMEECLVELTGLQLATLIELHPQLVSAATEPSRITYADTLLIDRKLAERRRKVLYSVE